MNVLIVDDSKAMRCIISRALREMGVPSPYLEAPNGKAALQIIADSAPLFVISDINMPEMSGLELLRTLRNNGDATPLGFVTSEASAELRQETAEAGAAFLVTKPFTAANLSQSLGPILSDLGCENWKVESDSPEADLRTRTNFPSPPQIGVVFTELLRRAVHAAPAPPSIAPKPGQIVAEYHSVDDGSLAACAVCDIPFAARFGAALTMIPAGAAEEAIRLRTVEETIADNFREVLNVVTRFFDHGGTSRVRLGEVHLPGQRLGTILPAQIARSKARLDLTLDISGYGKGCLTLISVPPAAPA